MISFPARIRNSFPHGSTGRFFQTPGIEDLSCNICCVLSPLPWCPFERKSLKFNYNISASLQAHPPSGVIILNNFKKSGLIQEASFLHPGRQADGSCSFLLLGRRGPGRMPAGVVDRPVQDGTRHGQSQRTHGVRAGCPGRAPAGKRSTDPGAAWFDPESHRRNRSHERREHRASDKIVRDLRKTRRGTKDRRRKAGPPQRGSAEALRCLQGPLCRRSQKQQPVLPGTCENDVWRGFRRAPRAIWR